MSIIIQIGPSHLATSSSVAPHPACIVEAETTLDTGPDLEYDAEAPVTSVDTSNVSLSTAVTTTHSRKEVRSIHHASHGFASCFGLPYQDHNYGAPPPPSPPQSPLPKVNGTTDDDTSFSVISTSTNNEDDPQEESITRCICGFDHDDEYMICCDRCSVWQHVDCMGLNQSNIPETYLCEKCEPRKVDRQKAKALQTRKKEAMTDSTTDDSGEEENSACHNSTLQTDNKNIKLRKRRKDAKGVNKSDIGLMMKRYKIKGNKERVERTRTGIRKKTKSESTSTADEEAQDAWESSLCEWSFKYEEALVNQYTPEVQLLAGSLGTRNNDIVRKISEQLLVQLCKVVDISGKKQLIAAADISQNQVLIEYKGKFLSATHFCEQNPIFNNRLYPYVLFFKMDKHSDICVDAREYGNEARFVGRSCTPNAEVKPLVNNGVLHLYLFSLKEIKKDEEVTISYDHSYAECPSERRKKSKKTSPDIDNDSSQASLVAGNSVIPSSPCKSQKYSPIKSVNYQSTPISHSVTSADSTLEYNRISQEENDTDEQSAERRKMTREERKIDAIMRAFERMEKTAKRRQQALERMAQQKAQLQKQDSEKDSPDVLDGISDQIVGDEDVSNLQPIDVPCNEELKASLITCQNNSIHGCRHRKGKRRRGSGTPSRRRTRSNSGGSDIMSPDELAPVVVNPASLNSTVSPTNTSTCISTSGSSISPSTPACNNSNTFPKTKKFLMQEWLQEKAETSVPVSCPLTIHTELSWNLSTASPTCYVRCTRDSPNIGGISSAHLRRNSTSGLGPSAKPTSLGSAKKRWLRQAMCESGTSEVDCSNFEGTILEGGPNSPLHNGCFSPNPHSDASSPCLSPPGDIVTPLKKRRLMRESLESMSSPRSPSPTAPIGWPASLSSIESPEHSNSALEEQFLHLSNEEKILQTTTRGEDEISITHSRQSALESSEPATNATEQWAVKEESSDMEPTSSSGVNQDIILSNEKEASPNASDVLSVNATPSDSSQDSSCLDLTCHDERESHVSSSESTVPTNRFQNNINLQPVNNVSSSTLNDNNEVTSTNKELIPVDDNKDSLPDSSLGGEVELGSRSTESEVCSVQQEQPLGKSNSTNDCVTSSHFVNTINDKQASSSSYTVPYSSIKNAQTMKSPVRIFPTSSGSNSTGISSCSSLVSSSVSQKRKVSLSEYRMRMREQASTSDSKTIQKTPENSPAKCEETSNVQDPSSTMCPPKFSLSAKIAEKANSRRKECTHKEEYQSGDLDVRWNNDQPEISSEQEVQSEADSLESIDATKENAKNQDQNTLHVKPVSNTASILHMCTQPPPPPPLPSSSSSNSAKTNAVPQFRYPTTQPYCRQPFIVGQVSSPFVALPPSLSPTLSAQTSIHVMHHPTHILPPPPPHPIIPVPQAINPPAASAFPTPPPPPLQPMPQNGYNSVVSSQNFIPSPIPQNYHYNQGLFK